MSLAGVCFANRQPPTTVTLTRLTPPAGPMTLTRMNIELSPIEQPQIEPSLRGERVAIVGPLSGMNRREVAEALAQQGATLVDSLVLPLRLIVIGERELAAADWADRLDEPLRHAIDEGETRVITETQLWQELGLFDDAHEIHRLYTPAMLAELLKVPLAIVRRWHRRGLIRPVRQVRKLPYFDFQEVITARRLVELLSGGMTPRAIEQKLDQLRRWLPEVERPLAQLSVIVQGQDLLLRQGDGLIEPGGQLRFDFETLEQPVELEVFDEPETVEAMIAAAHALEEQGELSAACAWYRSALAAGGPDAETNFQLAEALYRLGDVSAARERYYMAVELDENYVEARANLGCVLAECGERELAVAAFEGALASHGEYPDAHYHLARTLDELRRVDEAEVHWRAFLELSPDSPWALAARARLQIAPVS